MINFRIKSLNQAQLTQVLVNAFAGKQDAIEQLDRETLAKLRGRYVMGKYRKAVLVSLFQDLREHGTVLPDPTGKSITIKILKQKLKEFLDAVESQDGTTATGKKPV